MDEKWHAYGCAFTELNDLCETFVRLPKEMQIKAVATLIYCFRLEADTDEILDMCADWLTNDHRQD